MSTDGQAPGQGWFAPPAHTGSGLVTLVEGSAFCVAGRSADIHPGGSEGLYFLDTRLISRLELRLDGREVDPLSVLVEDPFSATHVGRRHPPHGVADASVVVVRRRYVGRGMRDEVEFHNYGSEATDVAAEMLVEADFADLFSVKEGHPDAGPGGWSDTTARGLRLGRDDTAARHVSVDFDPVPDVMEPGRVSWDVHLEPGASWRVCAEVGLWLEGASIDLSHPCGMAVEQAVPAERMALWRRATPRVTSDQAALEEAVGRAAEDLGALRIFDPDHPQRIVVAAGAPWFMTLFGRDSLLTAWMALLVDPDLALGVLQTLADLQGTGVDPESEEEPGRILHEVRFGAAPSLSLHGGNVYYGTADATPLFVMLLGELRRWGLADETVRALLPHADRAMRWIEEFGDRDGDGYVEYSRANPQGLLHQGWKDSHDSIRYLDGRHAQPPIALAEVQAYVYAAHLARARFADEAGEPDRSRRHRERAASLKEAFNRDFWLEERGWYAMALDGDKRPVDALASNIGHCLWTGIVDEERAAQVAKHLSSSDMFSGWGLRTLASSMAPYNPISYHCGSVWPHDTAIAAAGLVRYGFFDEAHRLMLGLLDLAATDGGRLPELVAGFSREEFPVPVPYPTSCSPQAWAASAPLLVLRSLVGLDPAISMGQVFVHPVLPPSMSRLHVEGIPLAGSRMTVEVDGDSVHVDGAPPGVEVVLGPRKGAAVAW
ncbi:MAG: glycogen debranching N-terminal domain-containing protein [Actinomycetota bacterium]